MAPTTHGKKIEKSRGLPETRISESVPAQCCEDVPLCTGPLRELIGSTAGRGLCPTSRPAVAHEQLLLHHTPVEAVVEEPVGSNRSEAQDATLSALVWVADCPVD